MHDIEQWDLFAIMGAISKLLRLVSVLYVFLVSAPFIFSFPFFPLSFSLHVAYILQWNLSNPDTLGTEECVLISEVS